MSTVTHTHPTDPAVLRGDGRYGFTVRVEGDDLVAHGVRATWFGGAHDPLDNGETASGVSTRRHPDVLGCALPMDGFRATQGSPLPRLPYRSTTVEVACPATGKRVSVPLIDLGPATPPRAHAAIDLTPAAFRALGGDPKVGRLTVDFRVLGGARHLPPAILSAARAHSDASQHVSTPHPAISATRPSRENGPGLPPTAPAAAAVSAVSAAVRGTAPAVAAASDGAATGLAGPAAPLAREGERTGNCEVGTRNPEPGTRQSLQS